MSRTMIRLGFAQKLALANFITADLELARMGFVEAPVWRVKP